MNRRTFYKILGISAFLPTILKAKDVVDGASIQEEQLKKLIPEELSGRILSDEEKEWIEKFLNDYNKSMVKLRSIDLPVDLLPGFVPKMQERRSLRKKVIDEG